MTDLSPPIVKPPARQGAAKKILVTGGAGFIGSHLVDYLMLQGHDVICVDSFFSGGKENIKRWLGNPNFEMLRHDIVEPLTVEVDEIYHLACPASPVHYQHNAIKTLKTNILGTMNMCGLAKRVGAKLLISSTSEVYGDPDVHPQVEEYNGNVNCIGLRSCYDEGKRAAEALVMDYHRQHNVDVRIARIFNTYGPRMLARDGRVVSNFCVQALKAEPITVYGDGSQTRSFCFVTDLVDGLVRLMNSPQHVEVDGERLQVTAQPINIGNPGEYSIKELAEKIASLAKAQSSVVYKSLPSDDPRKRQPDITKAKNRLGWQPTVQLDDGLAQTVSDFKVRADAEPASFFCLHQKEAV
mmetsp:Transcript_35504/g.92822  ORF Transcript_35504/g.92822 Transcript_35504/m.92822 type:complete len:354 (+) Transcript_35504:63-1124(+)